MEKINFLLIKIETNEKSTSLKIKLAEIKCKESKKDDRTIKEEYSKPITQAYV